MGQIRYIAKTVTLDDFHTVSVLSHHLSTPNSKLFETVKTSDPILKKERVAVMVWNYNKGKLRQKRTRLSLDLRMVATAIAKSHVGDVADTSCCSITVVFEQARVSSG